MQPVGLKEDPRATIDGSLNAEEVEGPETLGWLALPTFGWLLPKIDPRFNRVFVVDLTRQLLNFEIPLEQPSEHFGRN